MSFVATLIDSGSALSGADARAERARDRSRQHAHRHAVGRPAASAITFVKTYDEAGPRHYYPVSYDGVLNGDATEIEGRWRIGDGTTGKFLMIRSDGKAVAVEQKKRAKV